MKNNNSNCQKIKSLIDSFIIIGEEEDSQVSISRFTPTILSAISSNNNSPILREDLFIKQVFPPNFSFSKSQSSYSISFDEESSTSSKKDENIQNISNNTNLISNCYNIVFSYTIKKTIYYVYSHVFFEKNSKNYIPKAFCIVSQYPYFQFYHFLCQSLEVSFYNEQCTIPIEIVLYNIINYIPPPVNCSINIEFILSNDILFDSSIELIEGETNYKIKENKNFLNCYLLNKISGYPLIDFSLVDLINILTPDLLIKIFLFSFLEIKIYFFAKNIEILNFVMYMISKLSYPFNNCDYNNTILTFSKISMNTEKKGKIIGVNCKFEEGLKHYISDDYCFNVDLEEKKFFLQENANLPEINTIKKLIEMSKDFFEKLKTTKKTKKKNDKNQNSFPFLLRAIEKLYIILRSYQIEEKNKFDKKIFGKKQNNIEVNKTIQGAFYDFIISMIKEFFSFYKVSSNYEELLLKYPSIYVTTCKYNIDFTERQLKKELECVDLLFYELYKLTEKSKEFQKFIFKQECQPKNHLNYFYFLQFLNYSKFLKNTNCEVDFFSMINDYEQLHNSNINKLSFSNFHKYFQDSLKNVLSNYLTTNEYSHKSIELNQKVLKFYSYIIENLPEEKIKNLFPFNYKVSNLTINEDDFSIYVFKAIAIQTNDANGLILASAMLLTTIFIESYEIEQQMNYIISLLPSSNMYFGDIFVIILHFFTKIKSKNNKTNNIIIQISSGFANYLTQNQIILNKTSLDQLRRISVLESKILGEYFGYTIKKRKNSNKDKMSHNMTYDIMFQGDVKSSVIRQKMISCCAPKKTSTNKELSNLTFKLTTKSSDTIYKKDKLFPIFSPLEIFNLSHSMVNSYYETLNIDIINNNNNLENIIANLLLYVDVLKDYNEAYMDCFIKVFNKFV